MRKWLAAIMIGSTLAAGCGGGGGSPQAAPEPSSDQVQKAVTKTLHEQDMKDFLRTEVRTQGGTDLLELALDTQEGQKVVQDSVRRALTSSVGQQAILKQVSDMMSDPGFKTQVEQAIRQTLMEVLAKGSQAGKEKKEGKSSSGGQGGGSEGGGGGGGGGSSGGGGT